MDDVDIRDRAVSALAEEARLNLAWARAFAQRRGDDRNAIEADMKAFRRRVDPWGLVRDLLTELESVGERAAPEVAPMRSRAGACVSCGTTERVTFAEHPFHQRDNRLTPVSLCPRCRSDWEIDSQE